MNNPIFIAVCEHCLTSNRENPVIEFNFKDACIYYVCAHCKKNSKMTIKSLEPQPLPRARLAK